MLVWGGATDTAELGDGASYDPATRAWQTLPQSPLAPRTGIASVWTGSQWFLWGGQHGVDVSGDGAMYDPATRSWSPLPASPLSARGGATAVWTGTEVLVLGGYGKGREADRIDGAAYNPATRSWRRVAPNPAVPQPRVGDAQFTVATTVGPSVYVANNWSRTETVGGDTGTRSGVALARYDPWLDTWTALDNPQQHQGIGRLIWTGRELLVPASQIWCGACSHPAPMGSHGRRLDVGTGTWREVPHGPLDDLTPVDVWTGSALVAPAIGGSSSGPDGTVTEGDSAAWDPTTNKWVALPHAPISEVDVSLWTGRQLLLWGLPYSSSAKGVGASLG
jgi:N-acetylneuraminic acid mutarotase